MTPEQGTPSTSGLPAVSKNQQKKMQKYEIRKGNYRYALAENNVIYRYYIVPSCTYKLEKYRNKVPVVAGNF